MSVPPPSFDPREMLEHAAWLRGVALALCSDRAGADDLVQETFLAALKEPPRSAGSLRAWLGRVLRNRAAQDRRGAARRRAREEDRAPQEALPSAVELVGELDAQRALARHVLELPEPYREVLLWRYYRSLEPVQIASRLRQPAGTVRSRLSRGLALLRERLEANEGQRGTERLLGCALGLGPAGLVAAPGGQLVLAASRGGNDVTALSLGKLSTGTTGIFVMKVAMQAVLAAGALGTAFWGWSTWEASRTPGTDVPALTMQPEIELEELASDEEVALESAADEVGREVAAAPLPASVEVEPEAKPEGPSLPEAALVTATFVDGAGVPQPDVRLSVHNADWAGTLLGQAGTSDATGQVEVHVPLTSDGSSALRVRWSGSGWERGVRELQITPGEERLLGTIVLVPGAEVRGRVVDRSGKPVSGVRVWCSDPMLARGLEDDAELSESERGDLRRKGAYGGFAGEDPSPVLEETDEQGSFELSGVPAGRPLRLWAHREGWRYSWSEALVLSPGEGKSGVELVLEPLQPEDRIAGRVLDPEGNPFGGGYLRIQMFSDTMSMSTGCPIDDEGHFDFVVSRKAAHNLTAADPEGRWAAASRSDVRPGDVDVVLQLGQQEEESAVRLLVKDVEGTPVETYQVYVTQISGASRFTTTQGAREHAGGETWLAAPAQTFKIRVEAEGFETQSAGPYEGGIVSGGRIDMKLVPMPAITGVVLADGQPIAEAEVFLHAYAPKDTAVQIKGYESRVVSPTAQAVTDSEGRFELSAGSSGTYLLIARAEGWGDAELESLVVGTEHASDDLELALTEPGSVRVQVRPADGSDPAGSIVAVHRYLGNPRTFIADEQGEVLLEGLAPGGWMIQVVDKEVNPYAGSTSHRGVLGGQEPEFPTNCSVRSGGVTVLPLEP